MSIARSSFYYAGRGESPLNLRLLRLIDEQFLETPFYGSRQMTRWLRRKAYTVSRKRVRRLYNERRPHSSLSDDQTPEEAYTLEQAARRLGLRPASSQPEEEAACIMNPDPTLETADSCRKDGVHLSEPYHRHLSG